MAFSRYRFFCIKKIIIVGLGWNVCPHAQTQKHQPRGTRFGHMSSHEHVFHQDVIPLCTCQCGGVSELLRPGLLLSGVTSTLYHLCIHLLAMYKYMGTEPVESGPLGVWLQVKTRRWASFSHPWFLCGLHIGVTAPDVSSLVIRHGISNFLLIRGKISAFENDLLFWKLNWANSRLSL